MSQISHYATEILERHNNQLFKDHCRGLMRTTDENKAIASLALAVFGEAPAVNDNGFMGSSEDADNESGLVAHAKRELELAGLFDESADYGPQIADSVLELVRVLAAQGHSGGSAMATLEVFDLVARYKPLAPVGKTEDEWIKVADELAPSEANGLWQNNRRSTTFSRDGGNTWYDIEDASLNNGDMHRRYEDLKLGDISIGEDRVRVKDDAYEGHAGSRHNGQEGLVVGVRNGLVTVKYDSDDRDLMGHQHQAGKLERYIDKV